jgi:hypothetical protein
MSTEKAGKRNTGYGNSGYWNSGNWNSGNGNSGYGNSGNWNSGNWNSGNGNSGYGNSGHGNSGIFCTQEPPLICFDAPTTKKWEKIDHPSLVNYDLTEWISAENMTDEEKEQFPNYRNTGGCLRTYTYKEMWARGWAKDSEENKKKFMNLPNFDADKFLEITGIDVRKQTASCDGKIVEIEGKKYRLQEVK